MVIEYFNLIIFLFFTIFISFLLLFISLILITQKNDFNKNSTYECGFQSFNEEIVNFNVQYYMIAILFLIFDLEVMFILPWIACLGFLTYWGFLSMLLFFIILGLGFVYEWRKGSLEWN